MELGGLYQFVLLLVLVGMIIGVGIVALDKFAAVDGLSTAAKTALGNTSSAIATISNSWLGLIVIIVVLAIIITIMIKSFAGGAMQR